ncbi:MAG TPA: hypothetical protein VNW94_22780, partial [Streptosporangiaceae bacterium]|nr:hypothetical protein [Streptosporangiaceae bacterium]
PITAGKTYHLKVVANGPRLQVYLGSDTTPVIDVTDTAYSTGLLGLNVYNGTATLRNANAGLTTNLSGPWTALTSIWTDTPAGKRSWATGDGFYLSAQSGADFTYEADLSLGNAVAAGLTFRANATATQHYTANINTSGGGQIKLWRPGADLATHSTPITAGKTYHLKVVANGPRLQVYLGSDTTPVIDVTDTAYSTGLLGLSVYNGIMTAQNADVA